MSLLATILAGGFAGLCEHVVMYPVDTIKTRMQSQRAMNATQQLGLVENFRLSLQKGGIKSLYRGVPVGAFSAIPAHAAYFTIYDRVLNMTEHSTINSLLPWHAALAGACATVGHDAVGVPFDVIKQRLQVASGEVGRSIRSVVRQTMAEGASSFLISLPTTIAMNIPHAAAHFLTYESVKRALNVSEEELESSVPKYALAGGLGGAAGSAVSNPLDVIKTRLQLGEYHTFSLARAAKTVLAQEGLRGFTRGMSARMLYFAPSAAISMTSYEVAKQFCTTGLS